MNFYNHYKTDFEIDIVAISANSPKVFIAEVKRQRKNFKPELFHQKVEVIRRKLFTKKKLKQHA